MQLIGWILLLTAGLTAYYTFRVYFRVFVGPQHFEPGDEVHAHDEAHDEPGHAPADPGHKAPEAPVQFHPHPPGWAINLVLAVLAISTFAVIPLVALKPPWTEGMVEGSTAREVIKHAEHAKFLGFPAHEAMQIVSGIVALIGITVAFFLHFAGRTSAARSRADDLLPMLGPIPSWAQHKWYVDELYHYLFVRPLYIIAHICAILDKLLVDGLVDAFGWAPRGVGKSIRPAQSGVLHDYALRMVSGIGLILLIVLLVIGGRA